MAKLVLLLCLTGLLGAVLARGRHDMPQGRSFSSRGSQDEDHQQGGGMRGFRRPLVRFPGQRGEDGGTSNRRWTPRRGPWGDDRRGVGGRGGMSSSMKPSDRMRERLPHHRMVERLRAELSRFHNPRTAFGAGERGQGRRGYLPDARAAYDAMGGDPRLQGPRVDPRVALMQHNRGFSRRHFDNDFRGMGHFGPRGDHYPMRRGPGFGHPRGRGGPRFSMP